MGSPGFLFYLKLRDRAGHECILVSDESWRCQLDRSRRPGMYKRWFLRSLQECFDARLHPWGWQQTGFDDAGWVDAVVISGSGTCASIDADGPEYVQKPDHGVTSSVLRARDIPLMVEADVEPLYEETVVAGLRWLRDYDDWFDVFMPDCFEAVVVDDGVVERRDDGWCVHAASERDTAVVLTYQFDEQGVGFPFIEVVAPA